MDTAEWSAGRDRFTGCTDKNREELRLSVVPNICKGSTLKSLNNVPVPS